MEQLKFDFNEKKGFLSMAGLKVLSPAEFVKEVLGIEMTSVQEDFLKYASELQNPILFNASYRSIAHLSRRGLNWAEVLDQDGRDTRSIEYPATEPMRVRTMTYHHSREGGRVVSRLVSDETYEQPALRMSISVNGGTLQDLGEVRNFQMTIVDEANR